MSDHSVPTAAEVDQDRRGFLIMATVGTGAVGAAFAAVPFIASWSPSERARAAGAPVEVDVSKLEPGQMATVTYRKKAIYIVHRTPEMLGKLADHDAKLKDPEFEEVGAAGIRAQRRARGTQRFPGHRRHLHAPGLPAQGALRAGHARTGRGLAGRLLLSLPWFAGSTWPAACSTVRRRRKNLRIPVYSYQGDNTLVIGVEPGSKEVA